MRFSTRNTHKRGKAIVFAASAAILGIGGAVGYLSQKDASAEISSTDVNIFYANTSDYTSINNAANAAATTLGVEEAAFCNVGSGVDGTVTRVNPYTKENDEYWVFATSNANCPSSASTPEGEILLNNNGATILDKTYDDTYMATNYAQPLGVLGAFHIIGFTQLDLGNQTNGNILTPALNSAGSYIGYFEKPTISYARNIGANIGTTFSFANAHDNDTNVLVTGHRTATGSADNGTKWTINAAKSNMPDRIINGKYANNLWQEASEDQKFLDIAAVKTSADNWNTTLAGYDQTLTTKDYDFTNQNNMIINIPSSAQNSMSVLNLDKSYLQGSHDICVYGFDQHIPGTLLINIDLDGASDFTMNNSFKLCYKSADQIKYPDSINASYTSTDDIDFNNRVCVRKTWIHDKFENHIILNFYNGENGNKRYTGNLEIARETTSFVVAPDADVAITASSFQGIIIADNIQSRADTYYLSLHNLLPLNQESQCTITVHHYLDGTLTKVADDESYPGICGAVTQNIKASDTATQSYDVISAYYVENDEVIRKNDLPVRSVVNDIDKTYIIYYDKPLHLVVDHEWANGAHIKTDTDPTTYYSNDEYDTRSYILPQGIGENQYDYQHVERKIGTDSEMGRFADKDIHVTYVYTPKYYLLTVNHYWEGATDTPFATDNDITHYTKNAPYNAARFIKSASDIDYVSYYVSEDGDPIVGDFKDGQNKVVNIIYTKRPETCTIHIRHYKKDTEERVDDDVDMTQTCGNVEMELDISQKALNNGYKFVSGKLASERYLEDYTEEDFPMQITNNFPEKTYILYYEMPETPVTPETKDNNPAYMLSAAGAVFGLGTAGIFLTRRRQ